MSLVSIRKKGYLYKLPVNPGVIKKWNKRWFVLHGTTHEGIVRLDYYEREDHEATELGKRTISLRGCTGLSPAVGTKAHPHVFEFKSSIGVHVLSAPSETEKKEWLAVIGETIREDTIRRRKKKAPGPPLVQHMVKGDGSTVVKASRKGTSYDPSLSGIYRVTLEDNTTTRRLNLTGSYNLEVTPIGLALIAAHSGASIAEWQYKQIKSYGKSGGNFSFESGRGAETGEGTFIFITSCGKEIFGIIHRNIKRLKNQRDAAAAERSEIVARRNREGNGDLRAVAKKRLSGAEMYKVSDARPRPRSKRAAPDPPGGASGKYRTSADMEEVGAATSGHNDPHIYETLPVDVEVDPSKLYSKVNKPKKKPEPSLTMPPRGGAVRGIPPPPPSYDDVTRRNHQSNDRTSRDSARLSCDSARMSRDSAIFDNPLAGIEDDLPPISTGVSNPLVDFTSPDDLNMDDFDDHLFDALDQIELHDEEPDIGEDLEMRPRPPPLSQAPSHATARKPPVTRGLSQQEFDQMWDDICSTLPNVN